MIKYLICFLLFPVLSNAQDWSVKTKYKMEWTIYGINGTDSVYDTVSYTIINAGPKNQLKTSGEVNLSGDISFKQSDGQVLRTHYTDYEIQADRIKYWTLGYGIVTYFKKTGIIVREKPQEWIIKFY